MTNSFSCNSTRLPEVMASAKRAGHHAAGGVAAGAHHAGDGMGALGGEDELAVATVELGAQLLQLPHPGRALFHQHPHRVVVAEAHPGLERVLEMQFRRVVVADGRRDASLGQEGGGLVQVALGDEAHVPAVRGARPRPSARRCRRR